MNIKHLSMGALAVALSVAASAQKPMTAPQGGKQISDELIGIFFEDISYSADGGLNANLVRTALSSTAQWFATDGDPAPLGASSVPVTQPATSLTVTRTPSMPTIPPICASMPSASVTTKITTDGPVSA